MKKNILIYLVIFLSLAFAGASAGLIVSSQPKLASKILPKQLSPTNQTEKKLTKALNSQPAEMDEYDQIAKKTLSCMDEKLKDDNGIFFGVVTCNDKNKCDVVRSNRTTHMVIWSKLKYLGKHHDQQYLESALTDAEALRKEVGSIQNIHWNAKLALEMRPLLDQLTQGQVITQPENDKLSENLYQYRNVYYHQNIPEEYVDITPDAPIKISVNDLKQDLNNPDYASKYVLEKNNFQYLDYLPSEYIARYQLLNEGEELKKANFFFSQGLELIKKQKDQAPAKSVCMLGEASLDYYRLTQSQRYLDIAKALWSYQDLSPSSFRELNLEDKALCAYFTNSLTQITNEQDYAANLKQYMQDITSNHLNENEAKWGSDYCFESKTTEFKNVPTKNINTYVNSVLVSLLLSV
jgi:hypothetical protein